MIEVFRTNVNDQMNAAMIVSRIHQNFVLYEANFDLQDCDRILRVKSLFGEINSHDIVNFVHTFGFHAEVLPDQFPIEDTEIETTHSLL